MTKSKKYTLILGGVALAGVALLGYAISQSGRGAGMNMPHERVVANQVITRGGGALGGTIGRMITGGSIPENITFTGAQSSDDVFENVKRENVKYGITFDMNQFLPPPEACSPQCSTWTFLPATKKDNGWYVYGAATSAADIIAYLPNITRQVCITIQQEFGLSSVPSKQAVAPFDPAKPGVYLPQGGATTIKSQDGALDGQDFSCFDNSVGNDPGSYAYYAVLYGQ